MSDISLVEYARMHGRNPDTVNQLARRGGLRTARKIGRNWVVDDDEPYPDHRRKTMRSTLSKEADGLDPAERRTLMRTERIRQWSRVGAYRETFSRSLRRIPSSLMDTCTAEQLGQIVDLLAQAYHDGRDDDRNGV
jgi:hypothetical protein